LSPGRDPAYPRRKTRHRVAEAARGRINAAAFDELLVAVSEAVLNAHLHGRRPITVRVWTGPDRIVVGVHDNKVPHPSTLEK
jgi:anti-sigma regulatory factor (Ser/Thr protein kinase)